MKSEPTPISTKVVRGLQSAMVQYAAYQPLLVAWGGITKPAEGEFKPDSAKLRV